jgi:hypothetical protein
MTTNGNTYLLLTQLMGGGNSDPMNPAAEVSPVFRCPELAGADESGLVWAPGLSRSILFHPRAFPPVDMINGQGPDYPQRKLSSIRKSSDKIMFWDAGVALNWNMMSPPQPEALDGWHGYWGHRFSEVPPDDAPWESGTLNNFIDNGRNVDGNGWWPADPPSVIRFRHMKNRNTVLTFFDGHVETRSVLGPLPGDTTGRLQFDIKSHEIRITHHQRG